MVHAKTLCSLDDRLVVIEFRLYSWQPVKKLQLLVKIKVRVKLTLKQSMKSQKRSKVTALLFP